MQEAWLLVAQNLIGQGCFSLEEKRKKNRKKKENTISTI